MQFAPLRSTVYIVIMNNDMHGYVTRSLEQIAASRLRVAPAVALLGPRQCGKSTLAMHLLRDFPDPVYIDAELPSDRSKLRDPEAFLRLHRGRLVCIDEVQRMPELFPVLRSLIDQAGENGQYLVLGSASRDLIRQSSETLAGRISYLELTPFTVAEVPAPLHDRWLRGGFPRSYLADEDDSFRWRGDFIRDFLERDIPQLKGTIPSERVGNLWTMCAHIHGQLLNLEKLGGSLGVHSGTVRNYLDLLSGAFMVRRLPPFVANVKKRLVKSPRLYVRDTGILHALLGVVSMDDLYGHPVFGDSWEGLVVETILGALPGHVEHGFYRTSHGAEIDLVLQAGSRRIAVECKASTAPKVTRGFWNALEDLDISHAFVVAPVDAAYPYGRNVEVLPVTEVAGRIAALM